MITTSSPDRGSLTATELAATKGRVRSIDLLRGIVMVIMALDHVRDFFFKAVLEGAANAAMDPTNMQTTFPALFFTRWITHFCAPVFVFLAGTSIYLMSLRKSKLELSLFLFKRGLWLALVEIFIIGLGWTFNPLYNVVIFQVIWAIGASMILMAFLVQLPYRVILGIGLLIVFGHNLLDYPDISKNLKGSFFSELAYFSQFSFHRLFGNHFLLIVYAFVPWAGVMMLGYCLGKWYEKNVEPSWRRSALIRLGIFLTLLFVVLRVINGYGDPAPWEEQPRGTVYTILSFFNATKYPPSLIFLCMTIGPALIVLAYLENAKGIIADFFNVVGRVPMFYYILHFYLIHTLVVIVFFLQGHSTDEIKTPNNPFFFRPSDFGFPLWGVYIVWILVVIIMYPLCKKYDRYKSTHRKWWLSYL